MGNSALKGKKLVVLVGPTAVGKTAAAITLAEQWNTEIISADSRQIYREMEIGTAKPSADELSRIKHHFVNFKSIEENYNAGQFGRDAMELINQLFEERDVLILCGGSGLYIKALLEGFDEMPEISEDLRKEIIEKYTQKGLAWLQGEVEKIDPDYFALVDVQNPQRLMRALELNLSSGQPMHILRKKKKIDLPFQVIKIGLELPREELYQRIDLRMDRMIERGLFEEATRFYPQRHLNALQTVGYQEIFGHLEKKYDREEAIRLLKRNSRHYAKRQMTWFKKDQEIRWMRPEDVGQNMTF
ncbi:MAG: tRNA (adenosine(37)-N6)-dimethylallyltransferase MiaA [Cytophagales bacterium]|jgi:tRNA dimethylallyltransferase|nr:tRNA (adenosine(37)-N6)-dimethylallyltransferase MiaA [Cytophagales bacterium]MCA6387688.1 tRNA (adenosine(37)-N6)-dimethylallyltransferase MiaA [Cytophagales bacterium]MCA6393367.1 tRNA (adenosine(37)-N6)-dimethylallyltransferase MiaA [Cytophagales bacterium]MCA6396681.1 tRNA (adenosine(37)-N6)-dimethylallyltransferase MiaA [Cytophagales bacterium]MCA6398768.1 tRNA (adenosine(37)-N6)-dimethylallyltransferase MiaA [Cytophagales bacterium]